MENFIKGRGGLARSTKTFNRKKCLFYGKGWGGLTQSIKSLTETVKNPYSVEGRGVKKMWSFSIFRQFLIYDPFLKVNQLCFFLLPYFFIVPLGEFVGRTWWFHTETEEDTLDLNLILNNKINLRFVIVSKLNLSFNLIVFQNMNKQTDKNCRDS